jgi:hypothetical protein
VTDVQSPDPDPVEEELTNPPDHEFGDDEPDDAVDASDDE